MLGVFLCSYKTSSTKASYCCPNIKMVEDKSNILHNVRFSVYHAVSKQTDDTPRIPANTSIYLTDELIQSKRIAAISPHLKRTYNISWGDTVYVEGCKSLDWVIIQDVTNERYKNAVDLLVPEHIQYPSHIGCQKDRITIRLPNNS